MCLVRLVILGLSAIYATDDTSFDKERTNQMACFAAVECNIAPRRTKCKSPAKKKNSDIAPKRKS